MFEAMGALLQSITPEKSSRDQPPSQPTMSPSEAQSVPHEIPDPPPVDDKDYPLMQKIKSIPFQYSDAAHLVNDVNVILVTATDAEFRAVMGQAKPLGRGREYHAISLENRITFYLATYGKNKVAIVRTDQGARRTRRVLRPVHGKLQAQYVIAVGICYGLDDKKMKLGDVIVSRRIIDNSKKRVREDDDIDFDPIHHTVKTLYDLFKENPGFELRCGDGFVDIKPGDIVSESTLVNNPNYKSETQGQARFALGGEMEGAGIMELAEMNDYEGIVVKAVADWGDGKKKMYRKWQPFAAVAAAKYIWFHLNRQDFTRQPPAVPASATVSYQ